MNRIYTAVVLILLFSALSTAQWKTVGGVHDDTPNGTGHQTIDVGVVSSKVAVALVNRPTAIVTNPLDDVNISKDSSLATYLVGYANWDIETGRLGTYPYGSAATLGLFSKWFSGFDEVFLYRAFKIAVTPDSLVYVANNDPEHNILVFRVTKDTVETTDYRMKTGSVDIQGLAVDNNGYVYVCAINGSDANTQEVKVFKGIKAQGVTWGTETHSDVPIATINLPVGVYRGLTVSGDGTQLFVSDMAGQKVIKYTGSPATGYTASPTFKFSLTQADTIPGTEITGVWNYGHPLGMSYMNGNNLLFVAAARWWGFAIKAQNGGSGYEYSKIFMINPFTGARLDSINIAKYYFDSTGSYSTQLFTPELFVSGYTSSYDVVFDENKTLYTQSMYSWTIEKWQFTGTLPTISGTSVRRNDEGMPKRFLLEQNYPNPFNPSTTINFSVPNTSDVSLKVFDVLGKEVATLVEGQMSEGHYTATFNASALASGLYFYTLRSGNSVETKKMMLMK